MRAAVIVALVMASGSAARAQPAVEITLAHDSPPEAQTRQQLQRLLGAYDLARWRFTSKIVIDERAIPHSHPVLTLHTRHLQDDDLLLSTYVHEQLHWHLWRLKDETEGAIADLRKLFPAPPGEASGGARDDGSTYLHLLVCYLGRQVDIGLLGELRAKQVLEFWADDHYQWVYRTVLERYRDIAAIVVTHKLALPR